MTTDTTAQEAARLRVYDALVEHHAGKCFSGDPHAPQVCPAICVAIDALAAEIIAAEQRGYERAITEAPWICGYTGRPHRLYHERGDHHGDTDEFDLCICGTVRRDLVEREPTVPTYSIDDLAEAQEQP